jgi:AcrR family transcriptional regulator
MQPAAESPLEHLVLPLLAQGLPAMPPAALDPLLDAASTCLAANGLSRTRVADIARELGVVPSTVYRKVGSVEGAAWLLCAREAHRFLNGMPQVIAGVDGARMVTVFLGAGIRAALEHPVFAKIVRDEPDFVGRTVTRRLPAIIEQGATAAAPFLQVAMDIGLIRRQDPLRLAAWMARLTVATLLSPPAGDLQDELDTVLLPLLEP